MDKTLIFPSKPSPPQFIHKILGHEVPQKHWPIRLGIPQTYGSRCSGRNWLSGLGIALTPLPLHPTFILAPSPVNFYMWNASLISPLRFPQLPWSSSWIIVRVCIPKSVPSLPAPYGFSPWQPGWLFLNGNHIMSIPFKWFPIPLRIKSELFMMAFPQLPRIRPLPPSAASPHACLPSPLTPASSTLAFQSRTN